MFGGFLLSEQPRKRNSGRSPGRYRRIRHRMGLDAINRVLTKNIWMGR